MRSTSRLARYKHYICIQPFFSSVRRVQSRGFFDYIAETSKTTGQAQTQTTKKTEAFSWEFLDYFKKHEPEKAAEFERDAAKSK